MRQGKTLYRDPKNGRIAGVCAGLAHYFGIEIWLVRILTVTGFFLLAGPFVLVSYVAAWFILDKKQESSFTETSNTLSIRSGKTWATNRDSETDSPVELKTKVWQAGEPPKQAFFDIKTRIDHAEQRLRSIETYVTSKEYQLKKEINQL